LKQKAYGFCQISQNQNKHTHGCSFPIGLPLPNELKTCHVPESHVKKLPTPEIAWYLHERNDADSGVANVWQLNLSLLHRHLKQSRKHWGRGWPFSVHGIGHPPNQACVFLAWVDFHLHVPMKSALIVSLAWQDDKIVLGDLFWDHVWIHLIDFSTSPAEKFESNKYPTINRSILDRKPASP
jgi:hypothetical protein